MPPDTDVLILGGGVAGLSAGYHARQRGLGVRIFEAGATAGGNARTFSHGEFRFDSGAHRFHDRYPDVTAAVRALLGDELLEVTSPSRICWRGRQLAFPLSPVDTLKALGPAMSLRAGRDLLIARATRGDHDTTFEDVAIRRYGRTLAELFLLGYSEKLWGVPCRELLPSVAGRRLHGLSLRMLARELWPRTTGPVAHLDGRFLYPKLGIGAIAERLADACGAGTIATGSAITRLFHHDGAIAGIEINDHEAIDVGEATVVSTLAPALTLGLLDPAAPEDVRAAARGLRFRCVVLVTLLVERPSVTDCATIYFPEPDYPFTRLSEPRNRSPWMAPPGWTSLSIEIPSWPSDAAWGAPADALVAMCTERLDRSGLVRARDAKGGVVHRLPFAYPVLERAAEDCLRTVMVHLAGFSNLRLLGRVGRFDYVHVHDLMQAGRELADEAAKRRRSSPPCATASAGSARPSLAVDPV